MVTTLPRFAQSQRQYNRQSSTAFSPESSRITYLVSELDEKFREFEALLNLAYTSGSAEAAALELQKLLLENQSVLKKAGKYDVLVQQLITFCAIAGVTLATVKGVTSASKVTPTSTVSIPMPSIERVQPVQRVNTPYTVPSPQRIVSSNETSSSALDRPIQSLAELKALFAHPKAPGAIAIGVAEGNYDLKGNRLKGWYEHTDPGDYEKNKGFCSIAPGRGDHFLGGSPEEADAACIRMLNSKLDKVFSEFERAGAQLTLERAINSLDLHNQASPDVSRRFPKRLVEYESKSTGVDLIADARTGAFYKGDRNTATGLLGICRRENRPVSDWQCVRGDQMRRAKAIRMTLNSLPTAAPTIPAQSESKSFFSGLKPIANWFSKPAAKYSAEAIVRFMEKQGYQITRHPEEVNIVHIRNGIKAEDRFEDMRIIIQFDAAGKPHITGKWNETTKPGLHIVKTTRRSGGALTVAPGQWEYQVGTHYGTTGRHAHEALVQASPSKGFRDSDRDGTPDTPVWGKFWTNTHAPWSDGESVQDRSAGCNVTQTKKAHREFMKLIKRDRRYLQNPQYVFLATIINASDLGH